jgi:uncharacterized UBP type Zn finger protein
MFFLDYKNTVRGLRGLVNMGNTCFMNAIIQSLTHIPHLRDYFLTDQHICRYQMDGLNPSNGDANLCLMCELGNIFQGASLGYPPRKATTNENINLVIKNRKTI